MKRFILCGGSALAVAASLCAPQALAADPNAPTATAGSPGVVGELVVVAEKRAENIESVPVAVTAFSGKQRALMGIQTVQDLTDMTPGLSYTAIDDRPYIRGVGRNTDNLSTASAVATYYNGIYYGANAAIILQHDDLFIGNIEVDRGPQNTLHGSNSDGGTINYVSVKPTRRFYAEGRVGVANYDEYFGEAVVSGPISDNLRFRLGGNYTTMGGGYFKNLDGPAQGGNLALGSGGTSHYLEAQVDGNFGNLDVWAMLSGGDFKANYHTVATLGTIPANFTLANAAFYPSNFYGLCAPGLLTAQNAAACATATAAGQAPVLSAVTDPVTANNFPGNNPTNLDPRQFIQEYTSTNDQNDDVALAANVTYHFPSFDVTYLGGYQSFNYILNYTSGADSGVLSYDLAGAANPAICEATIGASAAACTAPLTIHDSPNTTYFGEHDRFFSNELDLTSTAPGPLQYLAGFYEYHEHFNQPVDAGVMPNQTQWAHPYYIGGACGRLLCPAPANPASAYSTSDNDMTYDNYGVFGSLSYKFNDEWKISGAVRYTNDHKSGVQSWRFEEFDVTNLAALGLPDFQSTSYGSATPALDLTANAICAGTANPCNTAYLGAGKAHLNAYTGDWQRSLDASWSAWTGEADVDWTPDRDTLVYGRYSRGYKAGGFSTYTIGVNPETMPEYVDAFEIGGKRTFGRTITVNGAAFYYNYQNDQVPLTVQNSVGILSPELYNVKSARNWGVELEGVWRPIDPLTLSAQYSYLNAKVTSTGGQCIEDTVDPSATQPGANVAGCPAATKGVQTQSIVGAYLPEAPPNKVSLNALYTLNFQPGNLTLSGTFVWKDVTYDSVFNRWYSKQPAYTQVNLRATWADIDDRYNVILFVDNVFDTQGYDAATGTLVAPGDVLYNPSLTAPRTFGVQFQYRFK